MTDQSQQDLVTVTIDGVEVQAPRNAMLIEVADQVGVSNWISWIKTFLRKK